MKRLASLLQKTHGSVAVEFALILPLLLMFIFGAVELGGAWYYKQMLVNASREGARYGALLGGDVTNADVETQVGVILNQAGFPGQFDVDSSGADGSPGTMVTVSISSDYALPVLGGLVPGVSPTISLRASTVMRHE